MTRTLSIKTLGCKLNQYESDQIAQAFVSAGWQIRPFGKTVDLVVINSCTVTGRSDKSSRNCIRQGAKYSKTEQVVVTGCLVNRDASAINKMKEVSQVFRTEDRTALLKLFGCREEASAKQIRPYNFFRTRRHIKIQDGCDGSCSFCIIPKIRGIPKSIGRHTILDEAKLLIEQGCPELVLTGISIGKYSDGNTDLAALVAELLSLPGIFRLRVTSIEPLHVTDRLLELLGHPKVCSHIHLPLQSGSDRILQIMQRPYRRNEYLHLVERIKDRYPDMAIGTDIIVGFPNESDSDFQGSLEIVKKIGFAYIHQFSYSTRKGTNAAKLDGRVHPFKIAERVRLLRDVANETSYTYRTNFLGTSLSCVIGKNRSGQQYKAVSSNYIRMDLLESDRNAQKEGTITPVEILKVSRTGTIGRIRDL